MAMISGGALPSDIEAIKTGTITFDTNTRIDNTPVAHGLGSAPDIYIIYPVSVPTGLGATWLGNFYSNKTNLSNRASSLIEFASQNDVELITQLNYAETSYPAPTSTEFYLQTSSPSSRMGRPEITYKWIAIKLK